MVIQLITNEIRRVNTDNGWNIIQREDWDNEDKVPRVIALIHSEITEAFDESNEKKRAAELVDVVIRALDCLGGLTNRIDDLFEDVLKTSFKPAHTLVKTYAEQDLEKVAIAVSSYFVPPTGDKTLLLLHQKTSQALELFRKDQLEAFCRTLAELCWLTWGYHNKLDDSLEQGILDKVEKNRNRANRHGGRKC